MSISVKELNKLDKEKLNDLKNKYNLDYYLYE